MTKKIILITGGAGFIGQHLALRLIKEGLEVRILDNFSKQVHQNDNLPKFLAKNTTLYKGDIRDKALLKEALHGVTDIIHFAAETGTGQSMYEIEKYFSVNVQGTAILLDILQDDEYINTLSSITLASSRSIYGEGLYHCSEHGDQYPLGRNEEDIRKGDFDFVCHECKKTLIPQLTPEHATLNPLSFYAITKLTQEQLVLLFAKNKGLNGFALRYQNVYGPGQSLKNPYTGILAVFSTLARRNLTLNVFEDGSESRDFVYIDDVVEATFRAITLKGSYVGSINIGLGESHPVLSIAKKIKDYFKSTSEIRVTGDCRKGDIRHNKADITKLKDILNYTPQTSLDKGLEEFLGWAKSQPLPELMFNKSMQELEDKNLLIRKK